VEVARKKEEARVPDPNAVPGTLYIRLCRAKELREVDRQQDPFVELELIASQGEDRS
jgi:hypothetical protein